MKRESAVVFSKCVGIAIFILQNEQLWNYTDNTIEEHTSVKSAFHYFHSCHLHPFYILGSASCSSGICSFRFNRVGHVINVLKIICSLPFHKPANIFGQIAATFLIRNFELLALVYPIESIFKINTVCVSDFELHLVSFWETHEVKVRF